MKATAREQYELACRIDRMVAARRIDEKTARELNWWMRGSIWLAARRSFPAPVPTWRSCDRWLRFLDIKSARPMSPRLVAPRHQTWF